MHPPPPPVAARHSGGDRSSASAPCLSLLENEQNRGRNEQDERERDKAAPHQKTVIKKKPNSAKLKPKTRLKIKNQTNTMTRGCTTRKERAETHVRKSK
jgi:hypothetical protein